jgi:hypothetical protein
VEQKREPMYKNRIRGIRCRASGQMIAKPISIKGTGCRSGGCALKAVELTSGDLPFVLDTGLRMERSVLTGRQKSAEGVVVAKSGEGPNGPRKGLMGAASKQRNS